MDTPFAAHFGSNYIPSDIEAAEIHRIVREQESERSRLEDAISQVRGVLLGLMHELDRVNSTLEAYKALLSPARRMPAEMLAEIFRYCVPERGVSSSVSDTPWVAARVCGAWRQVALSTPALWASIYMRGNTDELTLDFPFIRTCLSRSGVLPLSITLHHDTSIKNTLQSPLLDILDTIIAYSPRWRNLRLVLPTYGIQRVLNDPKVRVPCLESLDLVISSKLKEDDHFTVSSTATRLHTIHLSSSHLNARFFNLSWASLTHFSATSALTFDDCGDIFRQSASLESCSLRCIKDCPAFHPRPGPPIVVPRLHSFELHPRGDVGPLLDILLLPRLRAMHIEFMDWNIPRPWPKVQVLALLARSACALERLVLAGKMIAEADLVECVQCLPSLRELVVTFREDESLLTDRVRALLDRRRADDQAGALRERLTAPTCASGTPPSRPPAAGVAFKKSCRVWESMLAPGAARAASAIPLAT